MGIRFYCPNGHKLNVKTFQAGRRGICPYCGVSVQIPLESTRPSSKELRDQHDYPLSQAPGAANGGQTAPASPQPAAPSDAGFGAVVTPAPSAAAPATSSAAPAPTPMPEGPSQPVQPVQPLGESPQPSPQASAATPGDSAAAFPGPSPTPSFGGAAGYESPAAAAPAGATAPGQSPQPAAEPTGPADAIAEAPDAVWYVRPPSGGQFGPATGDIMRGWMTEGRVAHDALVWREGWRDWQEAGQAFPQLKPEPTPGELISGAATGSSGSGSSGGARRPARRRRNPATAAILITLLVVAVLILFVVLIYVVMNPPKAKPDESAALPARVAAAEHEATSTFTFPQPVGRLPVA